MAGRPRLTTPTGDGSRPGVAAFDVDGTLLSYDSLPGFLVTVAGVRAFTSAVMRLSPSMARSALGRGDRDITKEALTTAVLTGRDAADVDAQGAMYAQRLEGRVRPAFANEIVHHASRGRACVLVSASFTAYLQPLGDRLRVDAVLATALHVDGEGRLSGKFDGPNCRGSEKVRRLETWLASQPSLEGAELWAYGDSAGDEELLARADHACKVGLTGTMRWRS
jgi:phosphatidylglycerophosphatase C